MSEATQPSPVQKSGSNKTIIIVLLIAVILFLCFCCASFFALMLFINPESTTKDSPGTNTPVISESEVEPVIDEEYELYNIGEVAEIDGLEVSISDFEPEYISDDDLYILKDGMKLVSVEVSLVNNANETFDYGEYDFKLRDEDYYSYSNEYVGARLPKLSSGLLNPGDEAKGWITFEVPTDSEAYSLLYYDYVSGVKIEFTL